MIPGVQPVPSSESAGGPNRAPNGDGDPAGTRERSWSGSDAVVLAATVPEVPGAPSLPGRSRRHVSTVTGPVGRSGPTTGAQKPIAATRLPTAGTMGIAGSSGPLATTGSMARQTRTVWSRHVSIVAVRQDAGSRQIGATSGAARELD